MCKFYSWVGWCHRGERRRGMAADIGARCAVSAPSVLDRTSEQAEPQ